MNRRVERPEPVMPSRDLDETRTFYRAMGFRPWFDEKSWDGYEIMSRGNLVVHFSRETGLVPEKNESGCYLRVTDADACHAAWTALRLPVEGIPRMTAPRDEPWGMREFTIVDPSGNLLRVGHDLYDAYVGENPATSQSGARVTGIVPQFLVDDLDRSIAYYRDRLGFELDFCYESFYASVTRGGFAIHLKEAPKVAADRAHRKQHEHLDAYIAVSGVRELFSELQRRGADVISALEEQPWACVDFYVEDPDGYILCFSEQNG